MAASVSGSDGPRAEQGAHRVAGREMDQREDAEGDDESSGIGHREPPQDEADETAAAHHRRGPEIAVEPGDRARARRRAVGALAEAVALARIDDELRRRRRARPSAA